MANIEIPFHHGNNDTVALLTNTQFWAESAKKIVFI